MDVKKFLAEQKVPFQATPHSKVFTAQEVAAVEHVPGDEMAKPVIVTLPDGGHAMLLCPASFRVDLAAAGKLLGGKLRLADEGELRALFGDVEVGAEPPFGSQYGLPTLADVSLSGREHITFRAGRHTETITMTWADYARLEQPKVGAFARHL